MAIGSDTPSTETARERVVQSGDQPAQQQPATIATPIQTGRYRSRVESLP